MVRDCFAQRPWRAEKIPWQTYWNYSFQNKGYGTEALRLILSLLSKEDKYSQVEVCVDKNDAAALRMYKKVGFEDIGYIDESVPDCRNLMYYFKM